MDADRLMLLALLVVPTVIAIVVALLVFMTRKPLRKFVYQRHERMRDAVESAAIAHHNALTRADAAKAALAAGGAEESAVLRRESAGAEQEKVVADIAPGSAPEVLAQLLNGSKFNFLILSAVNDPRQLDRVILSTRAEGAVMPLPAPAAQNDDPEEDTATLPPQPANIPPAPEQIPPRPQPEMKIPPSDNTPNQ